jgi:DNA mismatch repair ATPase MutS
MGTNVVLALAGAPVRAKSLRTSSFAVWTSMRVRDNLSEGVSHFLAELQRLKAVADAADAASSAGARPVLFLLDEILHGTNSRERHLGAQGIVRKLVTRRATGAISTHDLALGALEKELPGKVRNVHFREQVETVDGKETMTFDYQLRTGVVTSSNALRLMRIVGLDVVVPTDE